MQKTNELSGKVFYAACVRVSVRACVRAKRKQVRIKWKSGGAADIVQKVAVVSGCHLL